MSTSRPTEQAILQAALGPGKECPAIDDLEQVLTGRIPAATPLARHVSTCSYCQTELQMLQVFCAEGHPGEGVTEVVSRLRANSKDIFPKLASVKASVPWWEGAFSIRRLAQASLALAAVLLIAAAALRLHTAKSPTLEALNQRGHEVFRSGSFDLVQPVGDLNEPPKQIRWEKVGKAARYQVRLVEVDGSEIWKAETADDHIDLPASARVRIVPAKTLFCEVDAFDSSGAKVSGTGLIRFRFVQSAKNHY